MTGSTSTYESQPATRDSTLPHAAQPNIPTPPTPPPYVPPQQPVNLDQPNNALPNNDQPNTPPPVTHQQPHNDQPTIPQPNTPQSANTPPVQANLPAPIFAALNGRGILSAELLVTQVNPAIWEISGHMVLKRKEDFDGATEANAWSLLAEVSLFEERFQEVTSIIFEAISCVVIETTGLPDEDVYHVWLLKQQACLMRMNKMML
ncbi:hypothetical protein CTI12_AA476700 [Artemisia annua]|uniref:GDPGP1-like C-terminal domain-containing protein n=1 Tax=Artemisia annua TaxID=35608 RepID=A0A2U1LM00_ARTAN|nr:hypothetical protein CTI12_AA476700 [Artemisia annua]